jgi:hypothetical protein
MLLHETRNDDGIRAFFNDVWESYVKTLLNPFYAVDKSIKSPIFESKVKAIAKVSPKYSQLLTIALPIANLYETYSLFTFPFTESLNFFLRKELFDSI